MAVIADRSGKNAAEITRVYNEKGWLEVVKTALLPITTTDKFMEFMAEFGPEVAKESVSAYQLLAKPALQRVLNEHYQMTQSVWDFFTANVEKLLNTGFREQVSKVAFVLLESIDEQGNSRRAHWDNMYTTSLEVRQSCQDLVDKYLYTEALSHINISNWRSYRWLLRNSVKQNRLTWRQLAHQLHCGFNLPLQFALRRAIA